VINDKIIYKIKVTHAVLSFSYVFAACNATFVVMVQLCSICALKLQQ